MLLYAGLHFTIIYRTRVPSVFSESGAFKNCWNLIKHSKLSLMLWTLPESTMLQKDLHDHKRISVLFTKGIVTITLMYIVGLYDTGNIFY